MNKLKRKRLIGILLGLLGLVVAYFGFDMAHDAHKCIVRLEKFALGMTIIGEKVEGCGE